MFDKLVNKNVFSWIIMMGGYAKRNHTEEAMELLIKCEKVESNQLQLHSRAS